MKKEKFARALLMICLALFLALSGGAASAVSANANETADTRQKTEQTKPTGGHQLSKTKLELALDHTTTLILSNTTKEVTWKSSDEKVVTVEPKKNGKAVLTALKTGTSRITAHIPGGKKTYSCTVTVYDPVMLKTHLSTLTVGKEGYVRVTGTKEKAAWSCSQPKVLTILTKSDNRVTFRAKAPGTALIKAKIGKRSYQYKITVKVKRRLKIAVSTSHSGDASGVQMALSNLGVSTRIVSSCNVNDYDGLVIPGGTDINPARYGEPNKGSVGIDNSLDALQLKLIDQFVKAKKPVFGVCRGVQLINVYFGGTLKQNIPNHRNVWHYVCASTDSIAYETCGRLALVVSFHHQAADRIGEGLKVTQWTRDRNVEALEHETLPVFAVQWHPELGGKIGASILQRFLDMCQ